MNANDDVFRVAVERARAELEERRLRAEAKRQAALDRWKVESRKREAEAGLAARLSSVDGRIDDTYIAELPLTIGYNASADYTQLVYVALGGVDVMAYLPPDVLAEIETHIELEEDDAHR